MKRSSRASVVFVAGCVLAAGCANDGPQALGVDPTSPPTEPASTDQAALPTSTIEVQAIDNTFRPQQVEVAPGTEVVWVNVGRNEHDVLSDFGFGVAPADFQPGDEYRYVFTEPGEYPYYCTIHGTHDIGMIGTVIVTDTA
ncbi:MAG: putative blue copper protein [Desertimonas sp.]|nr:putative blue copper protein [Desertimonas sp.]